MASGKVNEAELQERTSIDFPAAAGKRCHMQFHVQEALDNTNIGPSKKCSA